MKCGTGLKKVGDYGFHVWNECKSVELNEGLQSLGFKAMASEYGISEVTIPSTCSELGDSLFLKNPMKKIIDRALVPQTLRTMITGDPYTNPVTEYYETCEIVVPEGSVQAYRNAEWWKLYKNITGYSGVKDIITDENAEIVEIYTIDGRKVPALTNGVNICRMSNGKTKKVFHQE